ncbi:hypothetical protein X801_08120 [Opisthorchis viverrini]|uniref:DUF7083 domain-containing protein n=1 Tax=Opisthorchis viverrini TaxID=6198 RepID=A0A1S8WNS4_OPIVI|nr:hypothetical protein X801_08120 [Opisthorchis viverrini]
MEIRSPSITEMKKSSVDAVANSRVAFHYDAESNPICGSCFRRYKDIFRTELADLDDAWKSRVLLRKLGTSEPDKFINFILPKFPKDFSFDEFDIFC